VIAIGRLLAKGPARAAHSVDWGRLGLSWVRELYADLGLPAFGAGCVFSATVHGLARAPRGIGRKACALAGAVSVALACAGYVVAGDHLVGLATLAFGFIAACAGGVIGAAMPRVLLPATEPK
jgi:hypothetical protein